MKISLPRILWLVLVSIIAGIAAVSLSAHAVLYKTRTYPNLAYMFCDYAYVFGTFTDVRTAGEDRACPRFVGMVRE